jgi:hypothetical protein
MVGSGQRPQALPLALSSRLFFWVGPCRRTPSRCPLSRQSGQSAEKSFPRPTYPAQERPFFGLPTDFPAKLGVSQTVDKVSRQFDPIAGVRFGQVPPPIFANGVGQRFGRRAAERQRQCRGVLLPAAARSAALPAMLQPGRSTGQASGAAGTAGVVLWEIYEVPRCVAQAVVKKTIQRPKRQTPALISPRSSRHCELTLHLWLVCPLEHQS